MSETTALPQQSPTQSASLKPPKTSVVGALLVMALTLALILLGEKILSDINRAFNPAYDRFGYAPTFINAFVPTAHALSLPHPLHQYTRQSYETYRLLIHTAVVIPLFLLTFLFYYFLHYKRSGSPYRIISYAYIGFGFWMIVRLLAELSFYMIEYYKTAGVYAVLGMLIAIFTVLIILIQKKLHHSNQDTGKSGVV